MDPTFFPLCEIIEAYGPQGFPSFWGHMLRTLGLEAIALRLEAIAISN